MSQVSGLEEQPQRIAPIAYETHGSYLSNLALRSDSDLCSIPDADIRVIRKVKLIEDLDGLPSMWFHTAARGRLGMTGTDSGGTTGSALQPSAGCLFNELGHP